MSVSVVGAASPAVYTADQLEAAAPWVEIDTFLSFTLDHTNSDGFARVGRGSSESQLLMVLNGAVSVKSARCRVTLERRDWIEVPEEGLDLVVIRNAKVFQTELLSVSGTWADVNICTIFQYRPERDLEMHFHDYNEYWFIYRGEFDAAFADETRRLRPGDMLAIPAGIEHGTRDVLAGVIEGVGFSTTRIAQRRNGHLHRDSDGEPRVLIDAHGHLLTKAQQ